MSLHYAYNPQIWPPLFTALVLIALAVYCYRRRSVPGALPFTFALLFGAVWIVGISLEVAAVDVFAKIFWIKFQAAWLLSSATAVTCFVLEYAWPGRWLTRRNVILLSIPCLLNFGLILTNDLHHLVWQGFTLDGNVTPLVGSGNSILLVYAYILGVVNLVLLVWLFIRSPQHRWPVALMLAGQMAGRVVYGLEVVGVIQSNLVPIEIIAFWFPIPMYMIALFGFSILNPIPMARQMVIDQMREGMLVLNPQGRIASLNPTAEKIFGVSLKQVQGKPAQVLLPTIPELCSQYKEVVSSSKLAEIRVGAEAETRNYELDFSPLHDFRGLCVGHLLLLHDVTEQHRSQVQILEQQRALATLTERERLARELHDSLGQVLGFASMKVGATRKLVADGKLEKADDQMDHLESILSDAHADVREYILNLRTAPSSEKPFLATVRHYLDGFRQNYGIQVLLEVDERLEQLPFSPEVQVQVFRILQEALSNARKHGQAHCVQVSFACEEDLMRMLIQDDGTGFDPTQIVSDGHYGLQFIRERAEGLGGQLSMDSTPGQGTRILVEVPVKNDAETRGHGDTENW